MVDSCHMTFTPMVMLLQLPPSSDASFAERRTVGGEWEPDEKPPNLVGTEEENREINENVLASWRG